MRLGTASLKLLLLILLIGTGNIFAQNSWHLSGDLFLDMELLSKKPVFIRGQLPYQHWSAGWNLRLEHSEKIKINFLTAVAGGTPFDNPERFDYNVQAQVNVTKKFALLGGIDAAYNINQRPVVDSRGRVPNTGLSETFAGFQLTQRHEGKWQIKNEVYFIKNIRGNVPILNNDFTNPYISWRLGNNLNLASHHDNDRWALAFEPFLEGNNRGFLGKPQAIGASAKLEYQLWKNLVWQNGATVRHNIGDDKFPPHHLAVYHLVNAAPLKGEIFMFWMGPKFTF